MIDILAVGASAGGFEAIAQLLPSLEDFGGPILIVLHLPSSRESSLVEALAARTKLRIKEAEDKEKVETGFVYVSPPDYHLLVNPGGELSLDVGEPENYSRPSIDALFESAAFVYGERMAALLLTGSNSDGARGLKAVRDRGGITGIESPKTARYPKMPEAALELFEPDVALPLPEFAAWVAAGFRERRPGG
jgi:two-component system chemotaxis response regulator CheB